MLNELNAGDFEGMTYDEIAAKHPEEYEKRAKDKLQYIYPGVGGEGYLQVISRLRDMVREIERITDHLLIIGHRSVAAERGMRRMVSQQLRLCSFFLSFGWECLQQLHGEVGGPACDI